MDSTSEIDIVCMECGLFIRGEDKLKLHMATEHSSDDDSGCIMESPLEESSGPISVDDNRSQSQTQQCSGALEPSTSSSSQQTGQMDNEACRKFLSDLIALSSPQQSKLPDHLGEVLLNAALMELLKKQQIQQNSQQSNESLSSNMNDQSVPMALSTSDTSPVRSPQEQLNQHQQQMELTTRTPSPKLISTVKSGKANKSERRYICEYCGKQFAQAPTLIAHRRIHTGEKPYKCHICNAAFKQVTHRNDHVNSHDANYRPFVCPDCGRGFARKYSLSIHVLIHKGIYRFQCSYCDKKFRQSADKKKHELRHTRGKILDQQQI